MDEDERNIILLDIDGVLNRQDGKGYFIPEKVEMLKEIIMRTAAYIIITSSWRYSWKQVDKVDKDNIDYTLYSLTVLKEKLHNAGLKDLLIIDSIVGMTPIVPMVPVKAWCNRPQEVLKWIVDSGCKRYIVIDDRDMTNLFGDRMINTKTEVGLTEELTAKAIGVLIDEVIREQRVT